MKQKPCSFRSVYHNKGIFLHTLLLENEEQPSEKNSGAMFLGENKAHMPKFSYF